MREDSLIDERTQLIKRLRDAGLSEEEIERVVAEGRAPAVVVELAIGGSEQHTLTHVARESGLSTTFVRELMQAVGRPNPEPGEHAYTDADVEFARMARRFFDAGLPRSGMLEIGRVLSIGMSNAADAVRRVAGDALLQRGDSEEALALRYAYAADQLLPLLGHQLDNHFRSHLRSGMRGQFVTEAERAEGRLAGTTDVGVAFADLVDYTKLGERLMPEDVGRIGGRLTELSVAAVRRPVQLVKTIGDAAMFVSAEPRELVDVVARLVATIEAEGEEFPAVRVGMAFGPATPRGGDWFGGTVNVASRVTGVAKPGLLFATEAFQEQAPDLPWKRRRKKSLRGVDGRVRLYALDASVL